MNTSPEKLSASTGSGEQTLQPGPEAWALVFPSGRYGDAEVKLVHEPVLLETGGGLANIAGLLGEDDKDLILWNGDILSGCDIAAAYAHHLANGGAATLVVREQGPNRNVRITDEGFVTDMRDRLGKADPSYQYAGICVVTKAFVQGVPATIESLVEHFLRRLQAEPNSIQGFLDASASWHDLGTVEEYQAVKAEHEKPVRGAITPADAAKAHGYQLAAGGEVLHVGRVVGMQVQPGAQHPHALQVALQRRLHAFRRRHRGLDMQGADNGHGQAGFPAGEGTGRCGSDSGRRWGTGRPWSHRALAQRFFSTPQTRRAPGHGMLATCDNKCK